MSLYLGKYRRTRCSTSQPKKKGWYIAFYEGMEEKTQERYRYWDGEVWRDSEGKHSWFGAMKGMSIRGDEVLVDFGDNDYWAPIPKGEVCPYI